MYRDLRLAYEQGGSYIPFTPFMERAIALGSESIEVGDHPVGAVVVGPKQYWDTTRQESVEMEVILGSGRNQVHARSDVTAHGEIQAMRQTSSKVGRKALSRCVLYSSHEPCPMCAGAVANSRLAGVVYGSSVEDVGYLVSEDPQIRWRSNTVRMREIIQGRRENGATEPFTIEGFMRPEAINLLKLTKQALEYKPPVKTLREVFLEMGLSTDEVDVLSQQQGYDMDALIRPRD